MDKIKKVDLVQNRKLYIRIPGDQFNINANVEYAIRLASSMTFEIFKFDNTLNAYFEIADKVIQEKSLPAA